MTRWIHQLTWAPETSDEAVDAALDALPGHAGRHLPGSVGGAGATWDATSDADFAAHLDDTVLTSIDSVALAPLAGASVVTAAPLVKRTLLLQVGTDVDAETRRRFEADVIAMPRHIPSIRSWVLSAIDHERTPSRWTHSWEQEYASVDGLRVDYMASPYHWSCVDRWFDPEMPSRIVEREVVHVFYESPEAVLVD